MSVGTARVPARRLIGPSTARFAAGNSGISSSLQVSPLQWGPRRLTARHLWGAALCDLPHSGLEGEEGEVELILGSRDRDLVQHRDKDRDVTGGMVVGSGLRHCHQVWVLKHAHVTSWVLGFIV
jgi:hypothetical protein